MSTIPRNKPGSTLGKFSKGNEFSLSINFGVSGGRHCDIGCAHNPNNPDPEAPKDCYAVRAEKRHDRQQLAAKLERHEAMSPSLLCGKALLELKAHIEEGRRIDWLRISTNGAVPKWNSRSCTPLFKSQFKALLMFCKANGILVHFPVETFEKAEGYRSLLEGVACVRESVQDPEAFVDAPGVVSTSTGHGLPLLQRVEASRALALRRYTETGRKSIVCPAVVSSFKLKLERDEDRREVLRDRSKKSKCGSCTACANGRLDIIYPAH